MWMLGEKKAYLPLSMTDQCDDLSVLMVQGKLEVSKSLLGNICVMFVQEVLLWASASAFPQNGKEIQMEMGFSDIAEN